jgi:hypothetical protein
MSSDPIGEGEDVTELVDAVQEAMAGERVDDEGERGAVRQQDAPAGQIDVDLRTRTGDDGALDARARLRIERDREETVLRRVLLEDVGERRSDDRAEAPVDERPRRMLA